MDPTVTRDSECSPSVSTGSSCFFAGISRRTNLPFVLRNYVGSGGGSLGALFTPFNTQVSQYVGVAICCIVFTTCYAGNVWRVGFFRSSVLDQRLIPDSSQAQSFPFLSQLLFFENGTKYDQVSFRASRPPFHADDARRCSSSTPTTRSTLRSSNKSESLGTQPRTRSTISDRTSPSELLSRTSSSGTCRVSWSLFESTELENSPILITK